ncbi:MULTISPECIES: sigma-70 family RNA polymerase sigma factor [unclassified Microbulbifer]|uniref:RNA polymerase sigma factor n=1 Tax=unclassified Microbulbifer TaxID=2619833 RepID=UPI0027E4DFDB|nr:MULTISPECIES: sigma-70 family RNA polymerase sigma factor [unclassified Microbulbifer]
MKLFEKRSTLEDASDASLVLASIGGDQQAFGSIVSRYQRLLCSLAYSSLGSFGESEDVAQETFVEAWKSLESLREPEKLKPWLCGILRFKISHHRRKEARQPVRHAEDLQEAEAFESDDEGIEGMAIKEEEQALLWTALEKVPEIYREPLILYYREHRSVERVADELDLSEDAVKQRLSRGRKILQERMLAFVEGALAKSTPGSVFTIGVLAALPTIAPPAKAATAAMLAAHASSWIKWAGVATFMATVSGLVSSVFGMRASLDQSRTRRERRSVVKWSLLFFGSAVVFVAGMFALRQLAMGSHEDVQFYSVLAQAMVLGFSISYVAMTYHLLKSQRTLRASERLRRPDLFKAPEDQPESKRREIRSRLHLFGLPLLHVKLAKPEAGDAPAVGWIAAGDRAYGLVFAWGGFAVAPISVGIVSCGLVTAGAIGIGIVGMGTVGIGLLALGASAIGYKAYASLSAMGWESAFSGGFSVAKDAAIGPISIANQINNEQAGEIVNLAALDQTHAPVLGALAFLVIVPVVCYAKAVRRRHARPGLGASN